MGCKWDEPVESIADCMGQCNCPKCKANREKEENISKLEKKISKWEKKISRLALNIKCCTKEEYPADLANLLEYIYKTYIKME